MGQISNSSSKKIKTNLAAPSSSPALVAGFFIAYPDSIPMGHRSAQLDPAR